MPIPVVLGGSAVLAALAHPITYTRKLMGFRSFAAYLQRQLIWVNTTEKTYWRWVRQFLLFHKMRHPEPMVEAEITHFLSYLAVRNKLSAVIQ